MGGGAGAPGAPSSIKPPPRWAWFAAGVKGPRSVGAPGEPDVGVPAWPEEVPLAASLDGTPGLGAPLVWARAGWAMSIVPSTDAPRIARMSASRSGKGQQEGPVIGLSRLPQTHRTFQQWAGCHPVHALSSRVLNTARAERSEIARPIDATGYARAESPYRSDGL